MPAYVEVWCEKDACAMRDILNLKTKCSKKMDTSRRRLLAGVGGLSLGAAASAVQPRQAIARRFIGTRVHGVMADPGYDPRAITDHEFIPFTKEMEGIG